MNDELRAVLTEAQALHRWRGDFLGCGCGWNWPEERTYFCGEDERIAKAHAAHVVDALLSLPGVAVIQLPEPAGGSLKQWTTLVGGVREDVYPGPWGHIVISSTALLHSAEEARGLAAALLAAAAAVAAAEEEA
ncbi:hypothetical protein SEA_KYKAR_79 [Mycobacterium phage Kykar]|nr:hypothetical protein SEA_KYKAR_79 [Mycobacterium phage Kykar]